MSRLQRALFNAIACFSVILLCISCSIEKKEGGRGTGDFVDLQRIYEYQEAADLESKDVVRKLKIPKLTHGIDLSIFPNLTELHVSFCSDIKLLWNISPGLESLIIEDSKDIHLGDIASKYENLKHLAFLQCDNSSISGGLIIDDLRIESCQDFVFQSDFNYLKNLLLIDTTFKSVLKLDLSNSALTSCEIRGCENVVFSGDFPPSMEKLQILNNAVEPIELRLEKYPKLKELAVSGEVIGIDFGNNSQLISLNVHNSKNFYLRGELPSTLEYIDFFNVSFAEKTKLDLKNLPNLRDAGLEECENLISQP